MKDTEESKLKAEIDEINTRIKKILKNIAEIAPAKEDQTAPVNEEGTPLLKVKDSEKKEA